MIPFYLFSVILFASLEQTELLSLPGCPGKCGNLTILFPFGLDSGCYFDDSFHIICNTSFEPPKPFLRVGSAEVVSISLYGKLEVFNSSSSGLEKMVVEWAMGNVACHVARNDVSRYACQSPHSECKDSSAGQGYVCRCLPGYQGNPYLVDGCKGAASNASVRRDLSEMVGKTAQVSEANIYSALHDVPIYFIIGIVVVAPMLATTWITWTERQKKLEKHRQELFEQNGGNRLLRKLSKRRNMQKQLTVYTAQQMKSITNNYTTETLMLSSNAGAFYRATLSNNDTGEVLVMKIDRLPQSQINKFVDQLIFLSQPHTNLVRVIGCCLETQLPLIVYDLNGAGINDTLSDRMDFRFSCEERVKVAAGVARGLAHINSHKSFVHGNICSANIVMDGANNAKIFYVVGSNLVPRNERENNNSNVYSFGVILAELLTGGMRPDFVDLVKAGRVSEILDDEMSGEGVGEVVREVGALAEKCLNIQPGGNNMKQVATKLSKLIQGG